MDSKIAVIGAGASGLSAAIEAKRLSKKLGLDLSVTIFEQLNKPAKKILATGNGRCNFCNEDLNSVHYYGDKAFVKNILNSDYNDTLSFFKSFGIHTFTENGRIYPRSEQATSIREALLKACEVLNINIITEHKIEEIKVKKDIFYINQKEFNAVIIATGGNSSKVHGSDGSGFTLLRAFGHKITELTPALTALKVDDKNFRTLKGLRIKGNCALFSGKKLLKEEHGEIQFTDDTLSGIPVLNLSHLYDKKRNSCVIIDTCYEFTEKTLIKELSECRFKSPALRTEDILSGFIPQKLSYFIMKRSGIKENTLSGKLSDNDIKALAFNLKNLEFKISGVRDFDYSQVTCGGAVSEDFSPDTLMSKKQKGLFACGEILNVNGECGGYNLHFAWTSGRLSGASSVKYINEKR